MSIRIATVGLAVFVGACGYVSEYEKAVYDLEPTYCYKSIGKVACYREPFHRDERRLVNYFGPIPAAMTSRSRRSRCPTRCRPWSTTGSRT